MAQDGDDRYTFRARPVERATAAEAAERQEETQSLSAASVETQEAEEQGRSYAAQDVLLDADDRSSALAQRYARRGQDAVGSVVGSILILAGIFIAPLVSLGFGIDITLFELFQITEDVLVLVSGDGSGALQVLLAIPVVAVIVLLIGSWSLAGAAGLVQPVASGAANLSRLLGLTLLVAEVALVIWLATELDQGTGWVFSSAGLWLWLIGSILVIASPNLARMLFPAGPEATAGASEDEYATGPPLAGTSLASDASIQVMLMPLVLLIALVLGTWVDPNILLVMLVAIPAGATPLAAGSLRGEVIRRWHDKVAIGSARVPLIRIHGASAMVVWAAALGVYSPAGLCVLVAGGASLWLSLIHGQPLRRVDDEEVAIQFGARRWTSSPRQLTYWALFAAMFAALAGLIVTLT